MIARLDEVFNLQMGKTPSRNNTDYWINGQYDWISIADLGGYQKYVEKTKEKISALAVQESGIKSVPANTVIMSFKLSLGKTAITKNPVYTNEAIMAFIPTGRYAVLPDYFYYLFSARDWTKGTNRAVMGTTLNKATLSALSIEVPPLEKQHHIAATLDKVTDLISKRRQQLDKLDELVKARFVEMFGNFIYEHDRWKTCEVGDIADTIDPHPSHRTPPISANGVPYIGIADCDYTTKQINFETARKVGYNVLQEHIKRYTLSNGDFIIGKIGTIGKPFMVPAKQSYTLSANTVLIKPTKEKIAPEFLFAVFQSEYMDRIIDAEKKSTSQPAFGIQKVRKIAIPLPPMELQKQFAIFSDQTDKVKVTISHSLEKLETLKKALMQEYFG